MGYYSCTVESKLGVLGDCPKSDSSSENDVHTGEPQGKLPAMDCPTQFKSGTARRGNILACAGVISPSSLVGICSVGQGSEKTRARLSGKALSGM